MISPVAATRRAFARIPDTSLGILLMVASTVGFAGMHAVVRHLSADLHPFEIAFFRNFFGLAAIAPWFLRLGLRPLRTRRFGLHLTRALINVTAMMLFFTAVALTPLAQLQALGFTAPLFATVLAMIFLGERVRLRRWSALIIGFFGAMVIIRPGIADVDLGSILVLASSATWAFALIAIKILTRTDSSVTITAYMVLLMTPLSLIPASFFWQWPDAGQWVWLFAIGVVGTLSQMAMAQSFRVAEATAVLPFDFSKLIWGTLIGYFVFSEVPDIWTWIGGFIIFAGVSYIAYRESQLKTSGAPRDGNSTVPPG